MHVAYILGQGISKVNTIAIIAKMANVATRLGDVGVGGVFSADDSYVSLICVVPHGNITEFYACELVSMDFNVL